MGVGEGQGKGCSFSLETILFNCMCQLDWAKSYPDRQKNITASSYEGISRRDQHLNQQAKERSSPPQPVGITQSVESLNGTKRQRKEEFILCELRHPSSPALGQWYSWFSAFQTQIGTYIIPTPTTLRPSDFNRTTPLAFLILQFADGRQWDFSINVSQLL